ncbi:hypothetical protein GF389_01190, partial [Candidatus Dojkabacteria bacterium]|nr:hypothetical protein [Candidatus Dojkabacteria bacterium]
MDTTPSGQKEPQGSSPVEAVPLAERRGQADAGNTGRVDELAGFLVAGGDPEGAEEFDSSEEPNVEHSGEADKNPPTTEVERSYVDTFREAADVRKQMGELINTRNDLSENQKHELNKLIAEIEEGLDLDNPTKDDIQGLKSAISRFEGSTAKNDKGEIELATGAFEDKGTGGGPNETVDLSDPDLKQSIDNPGVEGSINVPKEKMEWAERWLDENGFNGTEGPKKTITVSESITKENFVALARQLKARGYSMIFNYEEPDRIIITVIKRPKDNAPRSVIRPTALHGEDEDVPLSFEHAIEFAEQHLDDGNYDQAAQYASRARIAADTKYKRAEASKIFDDVKKLKEKEEKERVQRAVVDLSRRAYDMADNPGDFTADQFNQLHADLDALDLDTDIRYRIENRIREARRAKKEKEKGEKEKRVEQSFEQVKLTDFSDIIRNPSHYDLKTVREDFTLDVGEGYIPGDADFERDYLMPLQDRIEDSIIDRYSEGRIKDINSVRYTADFYRRQGFIDRTLQESIIEEAKRQQEKMLDELLDREAEGERINPDNIKDKRIKREFQRRTRERAEDSDRVRDVFDEVKKMLVKNRTRFFDERDFPAIADLTQSERQVFDNQVRDYRGILLDLSEVERTDIGKGQGRAEIMTKEGRKTVRYDVLNVDAIVRGMNVSNEAKNNLRAELSAEQEVTQLEVERIAKQAEVDMDKMRKAELAKTLSRLKHFGIGSSIVLAGAVGGPAIGGALGGLSILGLGTGLGGGLAVGGLSVSAYSHFVSRPKLNEMDLRIKEEEGELKKAEAEIRKIISNASLAYRQKAVAVFAQRTGQDINEVTKT